MDFYKNKQNEYVEGFLSTKQNFNGTLILLREPNNNGSEIDKFWFRDTPATRYKNYFNTIISKYSNSELNNAAYANLFNFEENRLTTTMSKDYLALNKEEKFELAMYKLHACGYPNKPLTVYTCNDIYDSLLSGFKKNITIFSNGVSYIRDGKQKSLRYFKTNNLTIYEIYHPSYFGAQLEK